MQLGEGGATAHPLVAPLMWLGWEPVVKITVPLEWTLFTVINAVAWGSQQRAQLLQRPWWCCRFPSSLWVTSISNTEIRAQLYICFVSGGHTIQHSLLPALRYNFFFYLNTFVGRKKQLIKSFYSVSATRLLVSSTCVLRTILFIAYTYWSLCSMSAFNDVTPIKKSKSNPGSMHLHMQGNVARYRFSAHFFGYSCWL